MLTHLMYHSISSSDNTEQDIQDILESSRKNNKLRNITGCLIHRKDEFVQILEGEAADILNCFKAIEKDRRHHTVRIITFENVEKRIFSDWSMAFRDIPAAKPHDLNLYLNIINKEKDPDIISDLNKFASFKMFTAIAEEVLSPRKSSS